LFILRTDASNYAISGCLYQKVDDDIDKVDISGTGERPIQFFSQKLTFTQSHWSVIEKEAYAVIRSLQKFEHILFCSQIVVFSDHNPLSFLVDCVTQSSKLARWSLALQNYNIVSGTPKHLITKWQISFHVMLLKQQEAGLSEALNFL
jgi:RNase H-like domain found in reverse transcriptase